MKSVELNQKKKKLYSGVKPSPPPKKKKKKNQQIKLKVVIKPVTLYRLAQKKTERHTSHNMWMQELVSVYEVTSPEKHDTEISNVGSVVRFLWHIL